MQANLSACCFASRCALVVWGTRLVTRVFTVQRLLTRVLAMNFPAQRPFNDVIVHPLALMAAREAVATTARYQDPTTGFLASMLRRISRAHHPRSVFTTLKCFAHNFRTENVGERIHEVAVNLCKSASHSEIHYTHHGTAPLECPHGSSTSHTGNWQSPQGSSHCLLHGCPWAQSLLQVCTQVTAT